MSITKATQNVIAPITATGSTSGRNLQDRFADVINVKDFGAVGDGVTDDTAAIQAALDYAKTLHGAKVYIGNNMRCLVDSANLYISSNTTLEGPITRTGAIFNSAGSNYTNQKGSIILNPAYTIMVGDLRTQNAVTGGSVKNLFIINKDIAIPRANPFNYDAAYALVQNFNGRGVTVGDQRFFCNAAPNTGAVTGIYVVGGINLISSPITGTGNNGTFLDAVVSAINARTGTTGYSASRTNQFLSVTKVGIYGNVSISATFSGTGLGFGVFLADDSYVGYCHIVGFDCGVYVNGSGRYEIEKITGDNTNGIYSNNVHDVGRVTNCHFWNFVTTGAVSTGATVPQSYIYRREGIGYAFDAGGNDWSEAVNCFSFGYDTGFYVSAGSVRLIGCQCDGYGGAIVSGTKGFHVTSVSNIGSSGNDNHLIGCQSASHDYNFYIDSTSHTTLLSCSGWASPTAHVWLNNGYPKVIGGRFWNTPTQAVIATGGNLQFAQITGNTFDSASPAFSINASDKYQINIGTDNIYLGSSGINSDTNRNITPPNSSATGDTSFSIGGGNGYQKKFYLASGTPSSPAAVSSSNSLGTLIFAGHDGTNFVQSSSIRSGVVGTVSTNVVPSNFIINTTDLSGNRSDTFVTDSIATRPVRNKDLTLGSSGTAWDGIYNAYGSTVGQTVVWKAGTVSPNSNVSGYAGDLYTYVGGGAGNTLWVKESGNGTTTGWVAK